MLKNALNYSWILILAVSTLLVSCNKETTDDTADVTTEEFADNTVYALQASGGIGHQGCFELVFPISIEFEDGTTSTANSYDELRELIMAWKEANPNPGERPTFVFPIEVIAEDGELISVNDLNELKALKAECGRPFRPNKHRPGMGGCNPCFQMTFPISIEFPDGTVEEISDRHDLKQTIRTWKEANPTVTERPQIVFPITVEMEDGSVVTVNSKEELIALRESCE